MLTILTAVSCTSGSSQIKIICTKINPQLRRVINLAGANELSKSHTQLWIPVLWVLSYLRYCNVHWLTLLPAWAEFTDKQQGLRARSWIIYWCAHGSVLDIRTEGRTSQGHTRINFHARMHLEFVSGTYGTIDIMRSARFVSDWREMKTLYRNPVENLYQRHRLIVVIYRKTIKYSRLCSDLEGSV